MSDMAFESPNPADTGNDDDQSDDDPWAGVKSEEELRADMTDSASDTDTDEEAEAADASPPEDVADVEELSDPSPTELADAEASLDDVPGNLDPIEVWDREGGLPDDMALLDTSVSCEDCIHSDVCLVYAAIGPQLNEDQWDAPGEPPISPNDLAIICEAYEPADDSGESPTQTVTGDGR